jgi:hypothetical protein
VGPDTVRGWLAAYAAAVAITSSYNAILDAATPGESNKPAKTTTAVYRVVLLGVDVPALPDDSTPTSAVRRPGVDLIIQRADQRIVALEVELPPSVNDDDVTHLVWLRGQLGDGLLGP